MFSVRLHEQLPRKVIFEQRVRKFEIGLLRTKAFQAQVRARV